MALNFFMGGFPSPSWHFAGKLADSGMFMYVVGIMRTSTYFSLRTRLTALFPFLINKLKVQGYFYAVYVLKSSAAHVAHVVGPIFIIFAIFIVPFNGCWILIEIVLYNVHYEHIMFPVHF